MNTEEHRKGITDLDWALAQPKKQGYYVGDVIEFHVGGIGLINAVSQNGGWPPSYATEPVKGFPYRPNDAKLAWHREGDFKALISPSGVRDFTFEANAATPLAPTSGGDDGTIAMRKAVRFMLEKKADTCKVQLFHDGKERNVELRILKVEDSDPNKLDRVVVFGSDGNLRPATDAEQAEYDNYRANNTHHYTDAADFAMFKRYKERILKVEDHE